MKNTNQKTTTAKRILKVGYTVTDDQIKLLPQTPPVGKQRWFGCSCAPDRDTDEE